MSDYQIEWRLLNTAGMPQSDWTRYPYMGEDYSNWDELEYIRYAEQSCDDFNNELGNHTKMFRYEFRIRKTDTNYIEVG